MIKLQVCPSTLADGFDTYSPEAKKRLFDGKAVSHYMKVPSPSTDSEEAKEAIQNASRISLSGVQPKFSVLVDGLYFWGAVQFTRFTRCFTLSCLFTIR